MKKISIIDKRNTVSFTIYDRDDGFNTIEIKQNNILSEYYKTRLEALVLGNLYDKIIENFKNKKSLIIGYPTFYFEYIPDKSLTITVYNTDKLYTVEHRFNDPEFLEIVGE